MLLLIFYVQNYVDTNLPVFLESLVKTLLCLNFMSQLSSSLPIFKHNVPCMNSPGSKIIHAMHTHVSINLWGNQKFLPAVPPSWSMPMSFLMTYSNVSASYRASKAPQTCHMQVHMMRLYYLPLPLPYSSTFIHHYALSLHLSRNLCI